ncbi:MAG: CBS domain-containing protein [Candidatus Micrarchaeota archaeon]|nr:CBS domain-containing protein [Candidatus Micrarchaeota archaeon]MDE1850826.1 CBS domain-containing protein [Candidatus Micrarchaeota archaeon]
MVKDKQMLRVYEIMSYPVITAGEGEDIKGVAQKMQKYRIGSVVVLNRAKKAEGIITQGDIVRRFAEKKMKGTLYTLKARNLMSKPLKFIGEDETLEEAARTMVEYRVKRLCVVDKEKKKLVGIVTDNDIMKNANYLIDILGEILSTRGQGGEGEKEPEEFAIAEAESESEEES